MSWTSTAGATFIQRQSYEKYPYEVIKSEIFFALDKCFFRGGPERHVSVSTVHGALPIRFRLQISEKSPRLSTFWATFDFRIGKKVRMRYVRTSDYGDNLLCIYKNCMI